MNTHTDWEKITALAVSTDMRGRKYVNLKDLRPVFDEILTHTREEAFEESVAVIKTIIRESNENSSNQWFDALRCAKASIETHKDNSNSPEV